MLLLAIIDKIGSQLTVNSLQLKTKGLPRVRTLVVGKTVEYC